MTPAGTFTTLPFRNNKWDDNTHRETAESLLQIMNTCFSKTNAEIQAKVRLFPLLRKTVKSFHACGRAVRKCAKLYCTVIVASPATMRSFVAIDRVVFLVGGRWEIMERPQHDPSTQ